MSVVETPVLVTGATGFVGSHFVETLATAGARVRALVRRTSDVSGLERLGVERVVGGLDDEASLARAVDGVDVVYHLAAATRARSAAEFERINADGTRALARAIAAAARPPRRLVYLSSLAAAGPAIDGRPVDATDTPRPLTAYGRSKLAGERVCLELDGAVEVVVLRPPAVYGPRDREMLRLFRLAARGIFPVPTGPERPTQLIHVTDLARAILAAGQTPGLRGIHHAAESRAYGWAEVAGLFERALGRRVRRLPIPHAVMHVAGALSEAGASISGRPTLFNRDKVRELLAPGWLCETESLRRATGFEARIALAEGLARTARWYRERGWI